MIELRKDPVSLRWIIINDSRDIESILKYETVPVDPKLCPFCPGNENLTPKTIVAYDKNGNKTNDKDWQVRVIPNNKPILSIEGNIVKRAEGIYDKMRGVGAHEILIEGSAHTRTISSFKTADFARDVIAVQDRLNDLKKDVRFEYILVFKNHGPDAGETLMHPHFQLVALPLVPKAVKEEIDSSREYYKLKERCLFCDIIDQEMASGKRIVTETDSFVAFVPFASRYPFETWILPKEHGNDFRNIQDKRKIDELSSISLSVFRRLYKALDNPSYNLVLHSLPLKEDFMPHYHWHVEIIPKITRFTGFELGSGMYVNPTVPEESAKFLREAE